MNYYNPYFSIYPGPISQSSSTGLLGRLFGKKIGWSSILTNTQKVLGIVNQGIPMIKQVSPIIKNAKTMFKVMNEFKKVDTPKENLNNTITNNNYDDTNNTSSNSVSKTIESNNGPQFFVN